MRASLVIVALVLASGMHAVAQTPNWHASVGGTALIESWDRNETRESLIGLVVGVDRRMWRALALRVEGMLLHVAQDAPDGWLGGFTIGTRARWPHSFGHPFVDLAVGVSHATREIPVRGTASNYLILAGGGVEIPVRAISLELGARWLHLSNNGRSGRHRNPDIQALGAMVAVRLIGTPPRTRRAAGTPLVIGTPSAGRNARPGGSGRALMGELHMFSKPFKSRLPTAHEALPGRSQSMPVPRTHHVTGGALEPPEQSLRQAMFGMGCFWGAEKMFWQTPGVISTNVGYAGGHTPNPTYEEVCSGGTGHTEVVRVYFDPARVSYDELLRVFWEGHDPTQGMRQGNDVGTQYRSAIYYFDEEQRATAEASRDSYQQRLRAAGYGDITTEIVAAPAFYFAEAYHQQYLAKNPGGYCGHGGTGVACPVGVAAASDR